jgi:hypothetical protein
MGPSVQKKRGGSLFGDNELVLVSSIMILLILFAAIAERPDAKAPDWFVKTASGTIKPQPVQNHTLVKTEAELLSKDGYTNEGQTTEVSLTVDQQGTIELSITLTWADDYGSNDQFKLILSNETKDLDVASGSSGNLEVRYAPASPGPDDLIGKYTIAVNCESAPGVVGPLPVDRDNGNAWSLKVTAIVEA